MIDADGFVDRTAAPEPPHTCPFPEGPAPHVNDMRAAGYGYGTIWCCPTCGRTYHLDHYRYYPSYGIWRSVDSRWVRRTLAKRERHRR